MVGILLVFVCLIHVLFFHLLLCIVECVLVLLSSAIFSNKMGAFLIFVVLRGEFKSFNVSSKLNIFDILSEVSGMNGESRIDISLIALDSS